VLLISDVTLEEIEKAPDHVKELLKSISADNIELFLLSKEMIDLRDAFIHAGILTPKSLYDATHVAIATVAKADAIVSWNFKHIVRLDKMKAFNMVSAQFGYTQLTIISPEELGYDRD